MKLYWYNNRNIVLWASLEPCKDIEPIDNIPDILNDLANRLLSLGGERVIIFPMDLDNLDVLSRGELFQMPVRMKRMAQSQCHDNSQKLINKNSQYKLATGYGLSDDGIWRSHSWVIDNDTIIETTIKREKYYGLRKGIQ
jgi:hypothetical protein